MRAESAEEEEEGEELDIGFELGEDHGGRTATFFFRASDDHESKFCNGAV